MYAPRITAILAAALMALTSIAQPIAKVATVENMIIVKNMDNKDRELHFQANTLDMYGHNILIKAGETHRLDFPYKHVGNFVALTVGDPERLRTLAEFAFQGGANEDTTFYDVSAVTTQSDQDGVHWMYPLSGQGMRSGCDIFPCNTAYVLHDDEQTQSTMETALVVELYSS